MTRPTRPTVNELMLERIYGEFLEMPGLRLTCQQAQRLWGLDEQSCLALLEFLVEAKFLCQPGHGGGAVAVGQWLSLPHGSGGHAPRR